MVCKEAKTFFFGETFGWHTANVAKVEEPAKKFKRSYLEEKWVK